ncbi:hypothetical protein V7S43_011499 [Phytophthora oleae]|uniref:Secreted protein n=1 Tax=Phytophthora oleae TaxID=2107226 RepID=A0ABD3FA59_9STRA
MAVLSVVAVRAVFAVVAAVLSSGIVRGHGCAGGGDCAGARERGADSADRPVESSGGGAEFRGKKVAVLICSKAVTLGHVSVMVRICVAVVALVCVGWC